jgi:hypothetical protein
MRHCIPQFQRAAQALFLLCLLSLGIPAVAQNDVPGCGSLYSPGQYGPLDFRVQKAAMEVVLRVHFTAAVESLMHGNAGSVGADIDYTLRAIPNHPRALMAMMRLGAKEKSPQPKDSRYSVECWFQRAVQFRPKDTTVRMIYSTYLHSVGRTADGEAQLKIATLHADDNPFTHYNIGLHYFDLKNYEQALVQAHLALSLGWTHTDLRDLLIKAGKWVEPVEMSSPAAAGTPVAPSENKE